MKWLLALFVGIALMVAPMHAQDGATGGKFIVPKPAIVGVEDSVPTGDIIILKVSPVKDKIPYLKSVEYKWIVLRNGKKIDRFIAWPDNTSLVFAAGNDPRADIKVILVVGYHYEVTEEVKDKDGKVTSKVLKEAASRIAEPVFAQIRLVGPGPDPGPGPGPGPGPNPDVDPTFPDGRFALAKLSYDSAKKVTLDSGAKAKSALALASNYRGMASAVAAGTIKTPQDLLSKTRDGNTNALNSAGVAGSSWEPWDQDLQKVLIQLNRDKKMVTVQDFADAWNEIATGLSAVK